MFRKTLLTSLSALMVSGAAMAAQTPVEKIDVQTDLGVIENAAAAAYFANLETDLEGEIAARLTPERLVADGGSKITVDIDELELASTWANLTNLSESKLSGQVMVSSDVDHSNYDTYSLSVSYPDVIALLPAGTDPATLGMDSVIYYDAMVDAFADRVVKNLK